MIEHNELLREIDEDLRRERIRQWWKDFGSRVVAGSLALVLLTVGVVLWQNHQRERDMLNTSRLLAASRLEEQGKTVEAADAYRAVAGETRGNFKALASLRAADALQHAGKTAEAAGLYEAVHTQSGARENLRDLAGLRLANGLLATAEGEKKAAEILAGLSRENRPYRWSALELKALLDWKNGRIAEARDGFRLLSKAQLPESMKARVQNALASLPAETADAR